MKIDYVLDCGMNTATLFTAKTGEVEMISHPAVLNLPEELPRGSTIVCEYAHLGCPRKKRSLSQPFEDYRLLDLYERFEEKGITLKLFPQFSTPRAGNYAIKVTGDITRKKSDMTDPENIYFLLRDFPEISLMNPPKSFELSDIRAESYEWVADSNMYLNPARTCKYAGEETSPLGNFISKNIQQIYESVSETCRSAFNIEVAKVNRGECKKGQVKVNALRNTQIYSILIQLLDADGNPRVRKSTGKLPSWKFIKRYSIKMTPFHLKGGVARSNLYHHGVHNWVSTQIANELGVKPKSIKSKSRGGYINDDDKKNPVYVEGFNEEENRLFRKYRTQYCNAVRELFRAFKDIIEKDGVHLSIPEAAETAV